jgi:hypothetical protein
MNKPLMLVCFASLASAVSANANVVGALLQEYATAGAGPFTAQQGERLWLQQHPGQDGLPRSCTSCHTSDPERDGRHAATGKRIAPLAPSVNAKRLTERREIEKWLARNCKWTLGRECTAQEKGDLLSFLATR